MEIARGTKRVSARSTVSAPCSLKFALAPHDNGKRRRRLRVHRALKESRPRVFFCRPPRFNWMSLLRSRALLSVPGPCSSAYPRSLQPRGAQSPSPLLHSLLFSSLASRVRSPADLRSYIYCIEETRAAAFLAHAPLVMSGLQSPVCLSVRLPEDRSTGRLPSMPPTRPFSSGLPFAPLFSFSAAARFCPLSSFAWFPRYSISSLPTLVHIQMHEGRVALFS